MLLENANKEHLSFHTPGHKIGAWDITELSFSDNLSAPHGCIHEAERDITAILGSTQSFILTDGSTSGVLSMLYAAKSLGARKIAVPVSSHKSVFNGCKVLGLSPLIYQNEGTVSAFKDFFEEADALFFTSPDYYGRIPDLAWARKYCDEKGKLLLVDGAHGGHLHFDKARYAGTYADLWVDGVHKSLPALTQGAVVSARGTRYALKLREGVDIFRTTSPSYPIMASVEYAVKYPRNEDLEQEAWALQQHPRILKNDDWTKVCTLFGEGAFEIEKLLESEGIYPEFCDGNVVTFYLSPATDMEELKTLKTRLDELFKQYPYVPKMVREQIHTPLVLQKDTPAEWVNIDEAEGRKSAANCGLFPPCTPLITVGEIITKDKLLLLKNADNVFGVLENKILVIKEEN